MNGKKGPNTIGKDIGTISVFYPVDSRITAAVPYTSDSGHANFSNAQLLCRSLGEDYRLPTIEELEGIYVNNKFYNLDFRGEKRYWAATKYSENSAWTVYMSYGHKRSIDTRYQYSVRCIKR